MKTKDFLMTTLLSLFIGIVVGLVIFGLSKPAHAETIDVGYIELYPETQEITEEYLTYVESWDAPYQEIAQEVLSEYLQGRDESTLTEREVAALDAAIFVQIDSQSHPEYEHQEI